MEQRDLPQAQANSTNKHSIIDAINLSLHWDACNGNSCSKQDVAVTPPNSTTHETQELHQSYLTNRNQFNTNLIEDNNSAVFNSLHKPNLLQEVRNDKLKLSEIKNVLNSRSLDDSTITSSNQAIIEKKKLTTTVSIPALVVSDTTTGHDSCLSSGDLSVNSEKFTFACPGPVSDTQQTQISLSPPISSNSDHFLLSPRRSCDSAYSSSMETVSMSRDDADNDDIVNASECLPNHVSPSASLSVSGLITQSSSAFSSSSSIFSDPPESLPAQELSSSPTPQEEMTSNLSVDKDALLRKFSSSSNCSLRSSLSFEESEEDFVSSDESTRHQNLTRRTNKMKAQSSWTKLRRMVIWSPFMQSFKKRYPWVQLAGHAGNFQPGEEGCILKRFVEREAVCLESMTADSTLRQFVPTFHGVVENQGEKYTRMQDLLLAFDAPSLMDCKIGIRTYLEDELVKAKLKPRLRQDMYQKMIEISPNEPTREEREQKAVIKPRYMQWREQVSSTSNLGFRIEGIKKGNKDPSKDYKLTKTSKQVADAFRYFLEDNVNVLTKYIERLKAIRDALENSDLFHSHEAIGSSLLFVHDASGLANVWMIDFGKTTRLEDGQKIDHRKEWIEGNREDGYLFGVDNMIEQFENILVDFRAHT